MLRLEGVAAGYRGLTVVHDLSLHVERGEIYALIGANGAGKTTTLRAISGLIPHSGRIVFDGQELKGIPAHRIVSLGLVQVPEGRELFGDLTVAENLAMGAYTDPDSAAETLEEVYRLFPILRERAQQRAETMSGGQQQMLAIGRALMAKPKLLMLDEPSLGLAPNLVEQVFAKIREIGALGITVLMVEQNAVSALRMADRACVLESGTLALEGDADELLADERVRKAYLGM